MKEPDMSDNKDLRGGQDRQRINVNQPHEVRYWTEKFGVPEDVLKQAVKKAGDRAEAVERELKGSRE